MCGADVCLGMRMRESGEVFIFSADSSGFWSFLWSQLVCYLGLSNRSVCDEYGESEVRTCYLDALPEVAFLGSLPWKKRMPEAGSL